MGHPRHKSERKYMHIETDILCQRCKYNLRTLDEIGYTGPLTIEREIPQDSERQKAEIGRAVDLLSSLKEKLGT